MEYDLEKTPPFSFTLFVLDLLKVASAVLYRRKSFHYALPCLSTIKTTCCHTETPMVLSPLLSCLYL